MTSVAGTQEVQVNRITEMLGTMPREEIELLFVEFVSGFAYVSGLPIQPEAAEHLRARVAAMTAAEMAVLLAPLVRTGERLGEGRRARESHATRIWNPAHF
jgi:hypothetical protein